MITILLVILLTGTAAHAEDQTRGIGGDGLFGSFLEGIFSSASSATKQSVRNVKVADIPDQTYTGKAITPTVKVTFWGSTLRRGTDYTLTYSNNRSVGTAKVQIKGKGNFTGTKTVTFKIVKKGGSGTSSGGKKPSTGTSTTKKFTVKLSTTAYTYNGKYRKPTVKVTAGGKTVSSRYYTVKYTDNRSVGDAVVTVTGKGDYADYKGTASFRIDLKKTSIQSVKATGNKEIKVTWRKDTQADGYQIEYSTRKNFSGSTKTTTVRSGNLTAHSLTGLTVGKKYYVRIRSWKKVNGRNRYSEWSTVRNATCKE